MIGIHFPLKENKSDLKSTGDMDIWISRTNENAVKIVEILREFGFNIPELSLKLFTKENQITRIGFPPLRIEI